MIQSNFPSKISSTSIKKTQPYKSSTSRQAQGQQNTAQPTNRPEPYMDVKKTQYHKDGVGKLVQAQQRSTSSTSGPSTSVWRRKVEANPPSKISSVVTKQSNSTGQLVQSPEGRTTSNKNPSTSVQRSRVQVNSSSKLSPTAKEKTHSQKGYSPQKVWREKTKKERPTSEPKRLRNSSSLQKVSGVKTKNNPSTKKNPSSSERQRSRREPTPIYHIRWDGFERACESVTEICPVCERELSPSFQNWELEYYDEYGNEYEDDLEPTILPAVAVFACGHVFHSECLDSFVPDQSNDPLCFLCLSTCA